MISGAVSFQDKITNVNTNNDLIEGGNTTLSIVFIHQCARELFQKTLAERSLDCLKDSEICGGLNALSITVSQDKLNDVLNNLEDIFDYPFFNNCSLIDDWINELMDGVNGCSDDDLRSGSVPLCVHQYPNRHGGVYGSDESESEESEEDSEEYSVNDDKVRRYSL